MHDIAQFGLQFAKCQGKTLERNTSINKFEKKPSNIYNIYRLEMNQNWKALVKKKMKPRKHKQILRG